jgi:hypothetical protein
MVPSKGESMINFKHISSSDSDELTTRVNEFLENNKDIKILKVETVATPLSNGSGYSRYGVSIWYTNKSATLPIGALS